jgi:hypothetical protein
VSWSPKSKSYAIPLPWSPLGFVFLFLFSKLSTWSSFHVHLPHHGLESCSTLGLYQPHLIHTLSIEVSTKVSLIIQNQTRAFNLPLFGNWSQPFSQRFSIKFFWIHVACLSILPCVKDMDKFHKPELVAIAPPYICAKSLNLKACTYA